MKNLVSAILLMLVADIGRGVAQAPPTVGTSSKRLESAQAMGEPLTWEGDLASKMITGVDRFLLRELAESAQKRDAYWSNKETTQETKVTEAKKKLAKILGVRDSRPTQPAIELIQTLKAPAELARTDHFRVLAIRWKAVDDPGAPIQGEGILLEPIGSIEKNVILIPDAEQTPEQLVGDAASLATKLAANNCRVVIPSVISRRVTKRRRANLTDREYLYRPSFELGRHVTGYELQKIFAMLDWFETESVEKPEAEPKAIGIYGWGEGGRLALHAAALDNRIDAVCVSGYFGPRERMWEEPLDRNVFGLLNHFGDAELLSMALEGDTRVVVDPTPGPTANVRTSGGAPFVLVPHGDAQVKEELRRLPAAKRERVIVANSASFAKALGVEFKRPAERVSVAVDDTRRDRQVGEIQRFNESLLTKSPYVRKTLFAKHDVSSLETHAKTIESYREMFRHDVVGHFDDELLPPNPRSRKVFDEEKWTGHEVVLDVFPDVFAFGILLLPKGMKPGEKRPVVVCQHGLEGRPRNVIEKDHYAYHDYAAKLAERGFITFAPQNICIFEDRFRTLQRKANPIGKTLFSIMVPQHQQVVNWLTTLPQVDSERIAFYGLSYGGKSAMRIPPLVDGYCLSICSADFNDWVWKNASTISPYSYTWMGEYEIFEWDLGSTFNYAEMAALIAPKPFMVERGHFDGVAPDDRVAKEFAKVRHMYQAKLGIGDRCEIEFFVGPHTINGKGTYEFLHRHLGFKQAKDKAQE